MLIYIPHIYLGGDFHFATVYTYSYFTKTFRKLIEEIQSVFKNLISNADLKEDDPEYKEKSKKILLPTVIRTFSILRQIFDAHAEEFKRNPDDYSFLIDYINSDLKPFMEKGATTLKDSIIKRMKQVEVPLAEQQFNEKPPKSKISKGLSTMKLNDIGMNIIHPTELARQIALLDHKLYRSIKMEECLHMRWTKSNKEELAPNVIKSIKQFCNVGNWVTSQIVQEYDLEKRSSLLYKFVQAAYESYKFKNFNGAMSSMYKFKVYTHTQ